MTTRPFQLPIRWHASAVAAALALMLPVPSAAQEMPAAAIAAAVRYVAAKYETSFAVALDGFPDRALARESVRALGMTTGLESELIPCDQVARTCRNLTSSSKVMRLTGYERAADSLKLTVLISTPYTDVKTGRMQIHRQMRLLTLVGRLGKWEVIDDKMGVTT